MKKISWRDMIVACTVLLQLCTVAVAYNLDTEFPIIYNSPNRDYFGYTVALHKNRDGPIALVGAPRANSTVIEEVHQPGVLFKCNIPLSSRAKCEEVTLDTVGNNVTVNGKDFTYHDRKDDMWLGVSLDIQQDRTQNDIVTCGHLWKNQHFRSHYLPNGVCYVINSNLDQNSVRKLIPLINRSKQAIIPPGIYYYASGQAGTSAAYTEDGKSLILGAPGIYDWTGSIVSYPTDSENPRTIYKNANIPDPPAGGAEESYIGYSVTSGKFFDYEDIFYAVGAPRDSSRYGRVYIFKSLNQENKALIVKEKKDGTQFSEYFGSTVLGINLNGDAFTDLLVGAPFHSLESGGDEGRVAVYISNGVILRTYTELFGGSKPNARFGTAIANIGDLNQDGFNDVAIGAPYEDGKGAVYIYHGAELGMNVQYVQKIEAESISFGLSGFGIHISRGVDIDNNHYPDILIGSYASSNAVLLRTRPIVQLFPKLIFNPEQINTSLANCDFNGRTLLCASVSACLRYEGKHVPPTLDFENDIFVEPLGKVFKPRGFFLQNGNHLSTISEKTQLKSGADTCITHILYIYPNVKDFITPIQIFFHYRLAIPDGESQDFDKSYPIIDPSTPTKIRSLITFQTGSDSLPDLVPGATLVGTGDSGHVTHGEVSSVSLEISVLNKGEPAYRSELLIYVPPDIPVINQHLCTSFSQRPNVSLVCELGNPFLNNTEVKFQIKLDVTKIPIDKKKLDILLEAVTSSKEIAPDDNSLSIPLHLHAIAATSVTGVSDQEIILYNEEEHLDIPINIIHTYIVRNHGPSPLQRIDIVIYVPIAFLSSAGRMQFLTLTSIETDSGKLLTIPAKCSDTYLNVKSTMPEVNTQGQSFDELEIKNGTSSLNNHPSYFAGKPTNLTMDFQKSNLDFLTKKNPEMSNDTSSKEGETVLLDCDKENIECIAIQCLASPFSDSRKVAKIKVSAEVRLSNLINYVGLWYRVELVTVAKITMRDVNVKQLEEYPNTAEVKTVFIQESPLPPPEKNITR